MAWGGALKRREGLKLLVEDRDAAIGSVRAAQIFATLGVPGLLPEADLRELNLIP